MLHSLFYLLKSVLNYLFIRSILVLFNLNQSKHSNVIVFKNTIFKVLNKKIKKCFLYVDSKYHTSNTTLF